MEFGENIRKYRRKRGLTQEKLAELSNTSTDFLSRVELGKVGNVSIGKLNAIANALNVDLVDIIKFNPDILKDDDTVSPQVKILTQQLQKLGPHKADKIAAHLSDIISIMNKN